MSVSDRAVDLVLVNANVLTLVPGQSRADAVAVSGDRIVWVGSNLDLAGLSTCGTEVVDCQGGTIVPGLIDAHCHMFGYASRLLAVDCGPSAVGSIGEIQKAVRERAGLTTVDGWIRGSGYDELSLLERRHPTRWDLDEAVKDHPVKLNHRSGHACVLNTVALNDAGISIYTDDPTFGVIDRDPMTGEPTGLLLDMDEHFLDRIPPLSTPELDEGLRLASRMLVSRGVTSVQDAGASNSVEKWDWFLQLKAEEKFKPRITMMAGSRCLDGFLDRDMAFGHGDHQLRLGAVKVMLTKTSGRLSPDRDELRDIVDEARRQGFQIAVHAVEAEEVRAAIDVLASDDTWATGDTRQDRIEHCSECPPELLRKLTDSGLVVVTHPGFIFENGRRYLSEVDAAMRPWLYRTGSLVDAGVTVAAGSDAPVTDPDPFIGMYAAVTRRARTGETIGVAERVSAETALKMYTSNSAYAAFQQADLGSVEVGKLADLAVLDGDPTLIEPDDIPRTQVVMTVIGGRIVSDM